MNGSAEITLGAGLDYFDPGATAVDTLDGDLEVTITNSVDINTPGVYVLEYSASDKAGNKSSIVSRKVTVIFTNPQIISFTPKIEQGEIKSLELTFNSYKDQRYRLMYSTDLSSWNLLLEVNGEDKITDVVLGLPFGAPRALYYE